MADKKNGAGALSLAIQRTMLEACKLTSPGARLTYMMLLQHSNRYGRACPGNPRLARYCGYVNPRQVTTNLQAIEKARLAKRGKMITVTNGNGGFYRAMEWWIKLPKVAVPKPDKANGTAESGGKPKKTKATAPGSRAPLKRTKPCTCPGEDHKTVGGCHTWRWRNKSKIPENAEPFTEEELRSSPPEPPAPKPARKPRPEPTAEEIAARAKLEHDRDRQRRPWDFAEEAAREREEAMRNADVDDL